MNPYSRELDDVAGIIVSSGFIEKADTLSLPPFLILTCKTT